MIRAKWIAGVSSALLITACGGNTGGDDPSSSSAGSQMDVSVVSNGFGELLPHTVFRLVNEEPTSQIVQIRSQQDLVNNVRVGNPVRPTPLMNATALLPNSQPGNQFLYARFTKQIDVSSVLDGTPAAQSVFASTGAVTVVSLDPVTGVSEPVPGRYFINGQTFSGQPSGTPLMLPYQTWVELDDNGKPEALDVNGSTPGLGFPGTQDDFVGSAQLVRPDTLVFVVDSDNNLSTLETFPAGRQIRMRISEAVLATDGDPLIRPALATSTVGSDNVNPEIAITPPPFNTPQVTPGNGDQNVDPTTTIRVEFTEPVQPLSVGDLDDGTPPQVSPAIQLRFGPQTAMTEVPFTVRPVSVYDMSRVELVPVFNFPGEGPSGLMCGTFNRVDITINADQVQDLASNRNTNAANTFFVTGEGPALVNVPVTPDAVYIGRAGANPGMSVIDLNGFGQSTGSPEFDPTFQTFSEDFTNFPNNPNVLFQGSQIVPSLSVGTCTFDGGSSGVFSLTKDSALEDLVLRAPLVTDITDIMEGHALDLTFNLGPAPFGCQAGGQNVGGNICAFEGNKVIMTVVDGSTLSPAATNQTAIATFVFGGPNLVSWAPHPNPPPLVFPPPCVTPFINGQEPTSVFTITPIPQGGLGLMNLLGTSGSPFPDVANGVPPSGILANQQNAFMQGPSLPQQTPQACLQFGLRQQIGHFLYIIDRAARELVILNSNRMTVIDRLGLPDPTQMAMGPNLDLLAVSNQTSDTVTFVDIDPSSSTFHQIVATTSVGDGPNGIAWDPGNEDILVCNESANSLSLISAFSLQVRKTVNAQLSDPFDVAVTPRQVTFGLQRNVYFAYVANRNGKVAVFESGPDTVNGWGYDSIIGTLQFTYQNPKAIQPVHTDLRSAFWICHEGAIDTFTEQNGPLGEGALSYTAITSGTAGIQFFTLLSLVFPAFRDINLDVVRSLDETVLSGVPVDIAHDNQLNFGGAVNFFTPFSAGAPIAVNGKSIVRSAGPSATNFANRIFVAVPFPTNGIGVVDVINIGTGQREDTNPYVPGRQSIPAPNCEVLSDYFRE